MNILINLYFLRQKKLGQKIFLPRVKKIIKICKNKNMVKPKMMDVGAGYGTF